MLRCRRRRTRSGIGQYNCITRTLKKRTHNNNNNIIIVVYTPSDGLENGRRTIGNVSTDNDTVRYYHGGHTRRARRGVGIAYAHAQAPVPRVSADRGVTTAGNVRAVRPNRRRNTDEKLGAAVTTGIKLLFRPSPSRPSCFIIRALVNPVGPHDQSH